MPKQSSIEWLIDQLKIVGYDYTIEEALRMHKEEIEKSHLCGQNSNEDDGQTEIEYYKETYGK